MKTKIILTATLIFMSLLVQGQKLNVNDPVLAIYKLLSNESVTVKDSLAIYALNFQLSISKNKKGAILTNISANDSLAFSLFPSYKKLSAIDFSSLLVSKNKIDLIIPILIHGSSPEKKIYQDQEGNPLISLNAAVNAAFALYRPFKYNNMKESGLSLGHIQYKNSKSRSKSSWEAITLEPIVIEIYNMK